MQEEAKESNLKADSDVRVTRKTKVSARATLSRNTRRNKKVDSSDEVILP